MKTLILILLITFSLPSFAKLKDCYAKVSQAEKNECMTFEKDQVIGQLMTRITLICSEKEEIRDSKGGSIYPMILDECIAKEITKLLKKYPKEVPKEN